ncbi:hypothetical protein EI94DRAFT_1709589 [Lactarius quietus]|nr:hypothetical protein EI94DRAFT_1709589 [Lactarius quietus]
MQGMDWKSAASDCFSKINWLAWGEWNGAFRGHLTVDFLQANGDLETAPCVPRATTRISGWGANGACFALDEALSANRVLEYQRQGFIIGHTQAEGFINILLLSRGVSLDGGSMLPVLRSTKPFSANTSARILTAGLHHRTHSAEGFNEHFVTLDSTVKASK